MQLSLVFSTIFLVSCVEESFAIPVDNDVIGAPEIYCGPDAVSVTFQTRNNFEGHVFVKGLFDNPSCRTGKGGTTTPGINLPFNICNMQRFRSVNPRGIFVRATLVISFHAHFVTKVDRAYHIQCFYMEADKTVSQEIEVSMLTTGFQTEVVPMPVCRYDILDGGPQGSPVKYAIVGQQVYHKWTCDTDTADTFCMQVHSCFVNDGANDRVDLLDDTGCAQDRYLLRNIDYISNLMAGQETHVFKYADRPQLFFQCQIAISIKEPDVDCALPVCQDPRRGKRSAEESLGVIDVGTSMTSFDVDEADRNLTQTLSHLTAHILEYDVTSDDFCLSILGFGLLVAILGCIVLTTGITVAISIRQILMNNSKL